MLLIGREKGTMVSKSRSRSGKRKPVCLNKFETGLLYCTRRVVEDKNGHLLLSLTAHAYHNVGTWRRLPPTCPSLYLLYFSTNSTTNKLTIDYSAHTYIHMYLRLPSASSAPQSKLAPDRHAHIGSRLVSHRVSLTFILSACMPAMPAW